MDWVDKHILEQLRMDSRTPLLHIAQQLNVSEGMIRNRVKHLVDEKIIEQFTIKTRNDLFAIMGIQLETKAHIKSIVDRLVSLGVTPLYEVTGRFDIMCMIPQQELPAINSLLDMIRGIQGVVATETFTILARREQ